MSFWNLFKNEEQTTKSESHLQGKIRDLLPYAEEETLITVTCVAGLMARVAFSDLVIDPKEVEQMNQSLGDFAILDALQTKAAIQIALEDVKALCGIENHMYTDPLSTMLTSEQRYSLLKALFKLAASDGKAEQVESEEIRLICKGLLLENKHFIAARATVADSLEALKK
ncbi:MAG: hypothetical protein HN576_00205 [Bacteriovoracaceae bacterium]|jgi:uncharacterized tellurite resistance protein B-like protein|nr:hypothetical protein [Bacteriovoracaceae bacterium]